MSLNVILRALASVFFLFILLFLGWDDDSVFSSHDWNKAIFAYVTIFLAFIFVFILDLREFKKKKKWYSFIPIAACLTLITANVCIQVESHTKRNSPTLVYIACKCISELECMNGKCYFIKFQKNGSYMLSEINGTKLDYYEGKFTWQDSVITLDRSKIGNTIFSSKLVFRRTAYDSTGQHERYLSQIDGQGKEIDVNTRLYVMLFRSNRL